MMKRLLLAAAVSLLTAGSAMAQTVILVRHAEKVDNSEDPVLSAGGEARANALAVALSASDLTHIFVTPLQRTRMTADLTARAQAITPEVVSLDGGTDAHVRRIDQRIRALPTDAIVLVVGHSNTIPLIADALGEIGPAAMADCEYDRMTVISVRNSIDSPAIIARYGAPSAC
ncbi:SixA phosphatase family protein [Brevundimonas sp. UBA7664]|uniref:SixA phosphatase family protein n=1 Tax=Brevundimonas sp. UBA7664 TaxID=1946141 RepID=UPI0025C35008|nr:histidine phosphatase family protein [Brevundimonas sp. UBA7664]